MHKDVHRIIYQTHDTIIVYMGFAQPEFQQTQQERGWHLPETAQNEPRFTAPTDTIDVSQPLQEEAPNTLVEEYARGFESAQNRVSREVTAQEMFQHEVESFAHVSLERLKALYQEGMRGFDKTSKEHRTFLIRLGLNLTPQEYLDVLKGYRRTSVEMREINDTLMLLRAIISKREHGDTISNIPVAAEKERLSKIGVIPIEVATTDEEKIALEAQERNAFADSLRIKSVDELNKLREGLIAAGITKDNSWKFEAVIDEIKKAASGQFQTSEGVALSYDKSGINTGWTTPSRRSSSYGGY